jgi:hypothetical protein
MKIFIWIVLITVIGSVPLYARTLDFAVTDFSKADSIAALYPRHSLRDLRALADKLTRPLSTDVDKFRSIYTWVCTNIANDYALYLKNERQRRKYTEPLARKAWNREFSARVFEKLLHEHKTVCTGYAYLVKELAYHAGIKCIVVDGYGRTAQSNIRGEGIANHSWNAVCLNGKWYLCDATWSSGAIDARTGSFVKKYDAAYFLMDPALFVRNHYPLDPAWTLLDEKLTLQEFLNRPLIYSSIFQYNIQKLLPEAFDVTIPKSGTLSFQFAMENGKQPETVSIQIKGNDSLDMLYPEVYRDAGILCFDHTFRSKGTYVVHILFNGSYACTYTVQVK